MASSTSWPGCSWKLSHLISSGKRLGSNGVTSRAAGAGEVTQGNFPLDRSQNRDSGELQCAATCAPEAPRANGQANAERYMGMPAAGVEYHPESGRASVWEHAPGRS